MPELLKDPATALKELRQFQIELQQLQTRYFFSNMHDADQDFDTSVLDPLYQAEKASNKLLDKLIDLNAAQNNLGCKVKQQAA